MDRRAYLTHGSAADPLPLAGGSTLPGVTVAYETWGSLAPGRDNAVLITTGLSASSHVARHDGNDEPGWWDAMVGPGRAIDTQRWFVICANVLGGCFGSTGPTSINPGTGRPWGPDFPVVTVEDMVAAQAPLLDHLGIERLAAVVGASLGGMLALQWGALHPARVGAVAAIATPGRSYAFSIAWRAVQRAVVLSDPEFREGRYPAGGGPRTGLRNARAIGILSYRSPAEFDARFQRAHFGDDVLAPDARFEVEAYLAHNAGKFADRFDANAYLRIARAMDLFDLGRGAASYEDGVTRITSPCLVVGFSSDLLFPIEQQREVVEILRSRGRPARLAELETVHGHDAFLIEIERLGRILSAFVNAPGGAGPASGA